MSINVNNLISDTKKLHSLTDNKYMISSELLSQIITPEWFYSESKRIFENIHINWESLLQSDLINDMSLNVNLLAISRRDIIFEKSFCLWYQPYHVLPYTKWGIHVRFSSWIKATSLFYSEEPHLTSRLNNSIVAAFLYIYVHGMFHFIIENIFSLMELHTKNPLYYNDYYTNIYLQTFNTVNCLEETLANAYLYENASECHLDKEYLKNLLTNQENAYADFLAYTDTKFSKGCIKLISLIKDNHTDLFNYKINDIESLFNFKTMTVFNNLVPIWLHYNPTPLN